MSSQDSDEASPAERWLSSLKNEEPLPQLVVEPDLSVNATDAAGEATDGDALIGTIFAEKYQIQSRIGKGGMSTVYLVENILLGSKMALKLLRKGSWDDQEAVKRFRIEAQAVSKLAHQNLITLRDFGVTSSLQPYLVMDYLSGATLEEVIERENGLPLSRVVHIFEQLCNGLRVAHNAGIIHRDIKPSNIMMGETDSDLKLVDFGLAKIVSEEINQSQQLTQTGEIFGSPLYMSPEQCLGRQIDCRTDIYSVGCVIYAAMTGLPPFIGQSILETLNKQVGEPATPPSKMRVDLCDARRASWVNVPDLEYMVMRCLEKQQDVRYQTVDEIISDLQKIRQQIPLSRSTLSRSSAHNKLRTVESDLPETRKAPKPMKSVIFASAIALAVVAISAVAIMALLISPPPFDTSKSEEKSAIDLDTKAYNYFNKGEYQKAIPLLSYGIEIYKQKGESNHLLAENLTHLGECYERTGDFLKASANYKEALRIFNKIGHYKGSGERECLMDYARTLRALKQDQQAEEMEAAAGRLP